MVTEAETHLEVGNKKRELSYRDTSSAAVQKKCCVRKTSKSKVLCSVYRDNGVGDNYLCNVSTKKFCFSTHLRERSYSERVYTRTEA